MKTWKKIIVFYLCSAIIFSLAGCNTASSKSLDVMDSGDFEDVMDDLDYTVSSDDSNVISTKALAVTNAGDFEDVLDDMDYTVTVEDDLDYLDNGQEEVAYAYDDNYEHTVYFVQYEDEKDAVEDFDDMYDDLTYAKDDEDFEGTSSKTTGKNYQKCVVNGDFDSSTEYFYEGSTYLVAFQIENTLVMAMAYDNGESYIEEVDKIVEALGYFAASEDDAVYISEGLEGSSYAYDDDNAYYVSFFEYSDEEDAKDVFDHLTEDLKEAKDDEVFDGTSKETQGKNYQKCVINGEFSDAVSLFYEGSTYLVVFQVENTLVMVMAYDNGKSDVKEVDKIAEELGY